MNAKNHSTKTNQKVFRKKSALCFLPGLMFLQMLSAATPSAEKILEHMDANRAFESMVYEAEMEIQIGDKVRSKSMRAKVSGEGKAFTEFTNPEDKGTRILMVEDNIWMYFAGERQTIKLSGAMLKEGLMGSDLSYEDALSADTLSEKYTISLEKEESLNGQDCYVIFLEARVRRVPYYQRRIWVNKDNYATVQEMMYGKSGRAIKKSSILEHKTIDGKTIATKMTVQTLSRPDSKTTITLTKVDFNTDIDESTFSLRALEQ